MEDGAAAELTPQDFVENLVIKVADEIEVDVSTRAWKVDFSEAISGKQIAVIDGVEIPYLGIDALIESKSTYREKDKADALYLQRLRDQR